MASLFDRTLRSLFTAGLALFKRRSRPGVHAVALTPERRIVLVKLRYARGWRLPGGGRDESEDPTVAALRELREEIGLISHRAVLKVSPKLLIVEDVQYRPRRWSLEVERVMEAPADDLPANLSPIAARMLASVREHL